jgi:hypothetical protein
MSRWDVSSHRATRNAHLRKARRGAQLARETKGATRAIWCEHARQHIKAARREHWLLVAQMRVISASLFQRKTIGAHQRVPRRLVAVAA